MENIAAYEAMRSDLEAGHPGDLVLVHDRQLIGTYPTFNDAAQEAVARFGAGAVLDSGDRRRRQSGCQRPLCTMPSTSSPW